MEPRVFAPGELPERKHFYVIHRGVVLYAARVLTAGKVWGEDFILEQARRYRPLPTVTDRYLQLRTATCRSLPLPAVISRHLPLLAVRQAAYHNLHVARYRPLPTVTYRFRPHTTASTWRER